jgi:hypothetical protein
MSPQEHQLAQARAERDAALSLFKTDLAMVRVDLRQRGIGARIADRIGDSTLDMVEDAIDYAEAHKGPLAAGVAAVVAWFARGPIMDALKAVFTEDEPEEPERLTDRLRTLNPFTRE